MSSQFSYELDERQIRLLMQDAELEFDSAAWDRFEQTVVTETKSQLHTFTPKINFAISRSVIVPAIFIVLIGGLSAMLFSFVDFKKKDTVIKEMPLIPAPQKAKPSTIATPVKKETVTSAPPSKPAETKVAIMPSVAAVVKNPEPKKEEKTVVASPPVKQKAIETLVEKPVILAVQKKKIIVIPVSPRRRKKSTYEEIPTIQASSSNLNAENTTEPELELK